MSTSRASLITSQDCLEQLLDQAGGATVDGLLSRKVKRALQQGVLEVNAHRKWNYARRRVSIYTQTPYSTGTVAYTQTTKAIALTGGTFPAWANQAWIKIADKSYIVRSRTSGAALVLDDNNNPGADIAAGTSYVLYQESYRLPYDCLSILDCWDTTSRCRLAGIPPVEFDGMKTGMYEAGTPQYFTVTGDDWLKGAMCIKFSPIPTSNRQISYFYDRAQQPLRIWKYNTGTVTASAGSTALTGTGTAWTANLVGAVIRFGTAATEPTSLEGAAPYLEERVITAVGSSTTATLDEAVDSAYTAVKYYASDVIDVEPLAQRTAVMNCSALHFARERNADGQEMSRRESAYIATLRLAMQADRRNDIEDYGLGHPYTGFPIAHTPTNAGYSA